MREALLASVAWMAPPVSEGEPRVDGAEAQLAGGGWARPAGTWSRSQASLVAEK